MRNLNEIIVTSINDLIAVSAHKGHATTISNRQTYGLSFCIEGQVTYTHRGKEYVSDKNHTVILPQNQTYSLRFNKTGIFPVINFCCADFLCDTIVSIPIENPESYIKDFEQMKSLSLFEGNNAKIMSIFYGIIHRLSLYNHSEKLFPALKYIEKNFHNPYISNAMLASECNISEIYFRKLFSEQFNTTPKQFIIDTRIQYAKKLLSEGVLKINAIAERCGFSNPYHFCRVFKQKVGFTPSEYMNQNLIRKI